MFMVLPSDEYMFMVLLVYSVIALPGVSVVRFVSAFLDRLDPGGMSNSVVMSQFSGCPGKSRKHRPQVLSVPRPQIWSSPEQASLRVTV